MEFYYKNATLLYYANCLNKRKYYLDKNLKHESISLSRCSGCPASTHAMRTVQFPVHIVATQLSCTRLALNLCFVYAFICVCVATLSGAPISGCRMTDSMRAVVVA
jgi:hypothetical protein